MPSDQALQIVGNLRHRLSLAKLRGSSPAEWLGYGAAIMPLRVLGRSSFSLARVADWKESGSPSCLLFPSFCIEGL